MFYLHPLRSLFRWLERRGSIFVNPLRDLELRRPPRRLQFVPTADALRKLLESISGTKAVDVRDLAMVETMYSTGMRLREMIETNVEALNLKQGTVRIVGKGGRAIWPPHQISEIRASAVS